MRFVRRGYMPIRSDAVPQSGEGATSDAPSGAAGRKSGGAGVLDGGKNPYQSIILDVARRFGSKPLPLFVLGESIVLENTFKDCGFHKVAVRAVNHRRHFSSTAEIFQSLKESAFLRQPIEKLGETEREQAWLEIERQLRQLEGPRGVEVPGEFLIGVGTK